MPKSNMYQSLHTTVVGPGGKPLEIQIRTRDMHRTAQVRHRRALALQGEAASRRGTPPTWSWLGQMMEWLKDMADPREFMEGLKIDLYGGQVFVFTPKGDVVNLPAGATPVDFAYAIHTDVGHRTIGAKVGGKLVPLDYELRTGDTRRHPHVEGAGRGPVAGLAAVRQDAAGTVEDPAVVLARSPRGRPGAGARRRSSA